MLSKTAQKAIDAYGGIEFWQSKKYIEAEVSAKGLAFTLKRRPFFRHAKIQMEIRRPFSKLTPIGLDQTITGVLDQNQVRLENAQGQILSLRENPRSFFPYGRRLFYWDDLDMTYFANYAFWNYFTLPNLLLNSNIVWEEFCEGGLKATFPESIPTHSTIQEFYFDKNSGLLLQHNYTADIISKLAKAANCVKGHSETENIVYPSRRLVTPRGSKGKPLDQPILIDITVHHLRFTNEI
jgi:hypothetical protein